MTVVLPNLPPPGGSPQEVLFRRMLLQCSQRIRQPTQQEAANDWRTDPKFHCIIESLQEKLYDLEHAGPDVWPGLDVLTQYQAAVRAITSQLQQPELPAYCLRVSAQGRLAGAEPAAGLAQRNSSQGQGANSKQQPQRLSGDHTQQQPAQPHHSPTTTAGPTSTAGRAAAAAVSSTPRGVPDLDAPKFSLGARAQQALNTQQRLQDELTDELLEMGSELKSSTLAMQNAIRYRGKLLDDTEVHLVHSAENAKAVAAKAKEQYRQGNWNLCHTCIIVMLVFVIFTVMIVAIRLSSMMGLKGN